MKTKPQNPMQMDTQNFLQVKKPMNWVMITNDIRNARVMRCIEARTLKYVDILLYPGSGEERETLLDNAVLFSGLGRTVFGYNYDHPEELPEKIDYYGLFAIKNGEIYDGNELTMCGVYKNYLVIIDVFTNKIKTIQSDLSINDIDKKMRKDYAEETNAILKELYETE